MMINGRKAAAVAALATAAALTIAGCQPSGSHPKASAVRSALATSTAVAADKAQAQKDLQVCVATGHIAAAESCLKNDVPKAKRDALAVCLAKAALLGWKSFKDTGAQPCIATALQP